MPRYSGKGPFGLRRPGLHALRPSKRIPSHKAFGATTVSIGQSVAESKIRAAALEAQKKARFQKIKELRKADEQLRKAHEAFPKLSFKTHFLTELTTRRLQSAFSILEKHGKDPIAADKAMAKRLKKLGR